MQPFAGRSSRALFGALDACWRRTRCQLSGSVRIVVLWSTVIRSRHGWILHWNVLHDRHNASVSRRQCGISAADLGPQPALRTASRRFGPSATVRCPSNGCRSGNKRRRLGRPCRYLDALQAPSRTPSSSSRSATSFNAVSRMHAIVRRSSRRMVKDDPLNSCRCP